MYSSGLPILYPIACLFNFILYWVYKVLLLKFYQRTTRFNEGLATHSIGYIKYGILFHLVIGGLMYSNSNIISPSNKDYLERVTDRIDLSGSGYLNDRFQSPYSKLYLIFSAFLVILFLFKNIII